MRLCRSCSSGFDSDSWVCPSCGYGPPQLRGVYTFVDDGEAAQPAEFDQQTFEQMKSIEAKSFYIAARFDLMYWAFRRFFPVPKKLLDFGGGTGFWLSAIATRHPDTAFVGTDLSFASVENMRARLGDKADLVHTDDENLPFRDEFDLAGTFDVIEHIPDDKRSLAKLFQAVRPGGGLMVTVPQHMCLWSVLDDKTGHKRRYVGTELADKVRDAGFEVLLDTSFMALLFLPQYISRRFFSQDEASESAMEHNLPGWMNGVFRTVLRLELALIRIGIRFPFGGLRIVAARKPASSASTPRIDSQKNA